MNLNFNCIDPCFVECPKEHIVFNGVGGEVDPSLACGKLSIGDLTIPYTDIENVFLVCQKDAAAQVDDFTPTAFPDTDCCGETVEYGITLTWGGECNDTDSLPFKLVLKGTQDAESVVDAFVEKINANVDCPVTASNVADVLRLTADDDGVVIEYVWTTDSLTHALVTTASSEFGSSTSLEDALCFEGDDLDVAQDYEVVVIVYRQMIELSEHNCYGIVKTSVAVAFGEDASATEDILCEILDGSQTPASDYWCKITDCPCSEISS